MAKFFLFRRENPTVFSEEVSNTGDNLSVIAIPASHVSHMKGTAGKVTFVFNDAGVYEQHSTSTKEALRKTSIDVACPEGEEFSLIRDVLDFIANDKSIKNTMVFDAVTGNSTFRQAQLSTANSIAAKVYKQPTVMATQTISNDPADTDITSTATTTIAGVAFPSASTKPIIDYNDTGFTGTIGSNVGGSHTWTNLGTGGTTYDINADTGNPQHSRARNNNLATDAVTITAVDALHLNNKLTVAGEYTMYMVYGLIARLQMYPIYGSSSSAAEGFGRGDTKDVMSFSFDTGSAAPANVLTSTTDFGTKASRLQDPKLDDVAALGANKAGAQICYVWVIRRDKDFNIYIHDYQGDVIGYIPRKVEGTQKTDGDLSVDRLGGDGTGTEWKGELARFGVIPSDIGSSEAARIAQDLFARYNYYSF